MPDDLFLNTTTGDLDLTDGLATIVRGTEAILQSLRIRLRLGLGEWFLDTRLGVPYYDVILVRHPDLAVVAATLQQAILGTDGVTGLLSYSQTLDHAARSLAVTFAADTREGSIEFAEALDL